MSQVENNKKVISYCQHFYTIINADFYSDDSLSKKLVDIYQDYIFSIDINNKANIEKIKKLDNVMFEYINNSLFKNQIQKDIKKIKVSKNDNILEVIVNAIINLFDRYNKSKKEEVCVTIWI